MDRSKPRASPSVTWSEGPVFVVDKQAFGFGMQGKAFAVRNVLRAEERGEFSRGIEIGSSERHRAVAMMDQVTGRGPDRADPGGDFIRVSDGG